MSEECNCTNDKNYPEFKLMYFRKKRSCNNPFHAILKRKVSCELISFENCQTWFWRLKFSLYNETCCMLFFTFIKLWISKLNDKSLNISSSAPIMFKERWAKQLYSEFEEKKQAAAWCKTKQTKVEISHFKMRPSKCIIRFSFFFYEVISI